MKFDFWKKTEGMPEKAVEDAENVELLVDSENQEQPTAEEKKEAMMFEEGYRQAQNEIEVLEKVSIPDKKEFSKSAKAFILVASAMLMFSATGCHSRSVGRQVERAILHGRTVDEIERRDSREVMYNDRAQQQITNDEIKKIKNSNLPVEVKRQLIEELTGLKR